MKIESVLLTGGKSSRMGTDKANLHVDGVPLGVRTAELLASVTQKVSVLGREPIEGFDFHEDVHAYAGPLMALGRYIPEAHLVFVCSCDLPLFDPRLVTVLADRIESHPSVMAVVPYVEERLQPLAALYRAEAFGMISTVRAEGRSSMMAWLESIWVERVEAEELVAAKVDPVSLTSADTPTAMINLLSSRN